ncbi:MAG: LysM peptidoglycan-binding domain-containing protein [Planctomycetes bacterium]|jgi:5'-nucleotidase|nr:LysM peptidoglycan-binding domain-containing protein [Planctomycetota bacterium]
MRTTALLLIALTATAGCQKQTSHQLEMETPAEPAMRQPASDEPQTIYAGPDEQSKPRLDEIRAEQPPQPGNDDAAMQRNDDIVPLGGKAPQQGGRISDLTSPTPESQDLLAPPGSRPYTVTKGDNYWNIATRMLGDGQRWREIRDLNPDVDPCKLRIGQVILIPEK